MKDGPTFRNRLGKALVGVALLAGLAALAIPAEAATATAQPGASAWGGGGMQPMGVRWQ